MKKTKQAGTRVENKVRDLLIEYGWEVKKPRVSLGPADLVARRGSRKLLIQVKANYGSPYMNFRRDEREELLDESDMAGGTPLLVHWPPYGKCNMIPARRWPN